MSDVVHVIVRACGSDMVDVFVCAGGSDKVDFFVWAGGSDMVDVFVWAGGSDKGCRAQIANLRAGSIAQRYSISFNGFSDFTIV